MRKLTLTLTAAALIFAVTATTASAQTQAPSAAGIHAQIKDYTPIEKAACRGFGRWCPPGFVRACGPYRCWCRPCR